MWAQVEKGRVRKSENKADKKVFLSESLLVCFCSLQVREDSAQCNCQTNVANVNRHQRRCKGFEVQSVC